MLQYHKFKMNQYYREKKEKNGKYKMNLTGKPSVDKPWLQFYPEQLRNVEVPKMTIEEFLKFKNQDENRIAFEYYGN